MRALQRQPSAIPREHMAELGPLAKTTNALIGTAAGQLILGLEATGRLRPYMSGSLSDEVYDSRLYWYRELESRAQSFASGTGDANLTAFPGSVIGEVRVRRGAIEPRTSLGAIPSLALVEDTEIKDIVMQLIPTPGSSKGTVEMGIATDSAFAPPTKGAVTPRYSQLIDLNFQTPSAHAAGASYGVREERYPGESRAKLAAYHQMGLVVVDSMARAADLLDAEYSLNGEPRELFMKWGEEGAKVAGFENEQTEYVKIWQQEYV